MTSALTPILIAGPTASGKSALALALAQAANGCVINADALQVYNCWQVLSARPSETETTTAPHRLYGCASAEATYSTGHWLRDVEAILTECREKELRPIIIGGTGLYFTALTQGLAAIPQIPAETRQAAASFLTARGLDAMLTELKSRDPASYAYIDRKNPVRVQRAWEVLEATGTGLTGWHDRTPPPLVHPDQATRLVMDADRDWLADRIDRRFDLMLEQGALGEVEHVLECGYDFALPSMQAIGAPELAAYLKGELSLSEATERGKAQSRQYAKRQRTWFRSKMKDWTQIPAATAASDPDILHRIITHRP